MAEFLVPGTEAGFQYADREHEAQTALSGMWLFLATEVLFFGGLAFAWSVYRLGYPAGFAEAAAHADLLIGSLNTALLMTSSAVFTAGVKAAERGANARLARRCWGTAALGLAFLALKGLEWGLDFRDHLFHGAGFALHTQGAALYFAIYFVVTGLHAMHMVIGVALVLYVGWRARQDAYSLRHHTQVEVVGLYWSFVDVVWLAFYPLLYLAGRP